MYSLAIVDVLVDLLFQHLRAIYRTSTFDEFITFFLNCKYIRLKVNEYLNTKQIKVNEKSWSLCTL